MKSLDMRGKACPEPVIRTVEMIESMEKPDVLSVLVDNDIAVENLSRMAASKNYKSSSQKKGDDFEVLIEVSEQAAVKEEQAKNIVVAVTADVMGGGDETLGKNLLKGFIFALSKQASLPSTIVFYNAGAFITTEGSESLEDLKSMEAAGVEILTCGACLDFYNLKEKLSVGQVSNMYVIVEKLSNASLVIRP